MNPVYPGFGTLGTRLQRLETGAQRTQRGQPRPTSGIYVRTPKALLTTVPSSQSQKLSLLHSSVLKKGSLPPSGNIFGFAYTATTTSITWYWDGTNGSSVIVIHRADGTNFTVPTAGSGFTVTGLIANTTYYFLPFWNAVQNACNIGWVQGTTGVPQVAFVLADTTSIYSGSDLIQQNAQGNEPLSSGFMSAVTPMTGTGGGGGGGVGGCVMAGTEIETLGDLPYTIEIIEETDWMHIEIEDGRFLNCSFDHPLYHTWKGRITAEEVERGDLLLTDTGEREVTKVCRLARKCSKHKLEMGEGHLYYANGFLSHNQKIHP